MKILVVTNLYPTPNRPYVSTFVKDQVESLQKYYSDLSIDVRVIEGNSPRWGYLREILLLPYVVKKCKYDIVHAHFGLTLVSTILLRVPVIITFHGSDLLVSPTKYISRLLAPMASKVIVVAPKLKESLGYGEVIPCGIDVKMFELPISFAKRHKSKIPRNIKILFPSDPARKVKNYSLFLAVCQELKIRGYIVEEVHLVNIARAKIQEIFWGCDIMLLTSFSEGSPTVIKEAIASKLPFVSVDVGDVKEWADRVEFGVVVPDREPKTLSDAVVSLIDGIKDRELLDNSRITQKMDMPFIARRIRHIYDQVMSEHL